MSPDNGSCHPEPHEHHPDDGVHYLSGPSLKAHPRCLTDRLVHWAEHTPDAPFLAERQRNHASAAWHTMSYAEALAAVECLAQALLDHDLSLKRPLMVLSGNGIHHALLACAAMHVGIPYAPVSPSYALLANDYTKLKHVVDLVSPGMIFIDEEARFEHALECVSDATVHRLATVPSVSAHSIDTLMATPKRAAVDHAHADVGPDTIAKLLFTSGSTGMPKAVINTQRMICSNQAMLGQTLPFLESAPPVLMDWLPWHHTFGGNTILGMTIHNGGTLYIDDGSPTVDGVERTVQNLLEISPTFYCNVPKGFEALVDHLQQSDALREAFFRNLKMMHFGGASLPSHVSEHLDILSLQETGRRVPMLTGLGSTEACLSFCTQNRDHVRGLVGQPVAGMTVKLVPSGDKLEARLKGPNVTPGYWKDDTRSETVFDEEGYYCTGDAMRFHDASSPEKGLMFDGRLSENFKLMTGTWVNVGALRLQLVEDMAPLAQDIVLVGEGRPYLTGLLVLNKTHCADLLGTEPDLAELARNDIVRRFLADRLTVHQQGKSSSMRLERLLILEAPLSFDKGEVTEKGSVNQRLVRERHTEHLDTLYADPPGAEVIMPSRC
ncbi:feruloyl-CoA synthase [Larsenimonas salina]|uniref:feruloyl-CoA synthase n=1 Tax=Larsenimonas salina TaxID=1295565 RepID=UPI002072EC7B|nr:feruloyl-CoA synthase [Larsenimonas salina]MCM5704407.1 feruloyl-CoA synthase [Larsenimonas salina]